MNKNLAKLMVACFLFGLMLMAILIVLFFSPPSLPDVTLASLTVNRFNFTGEHISGYLNMQVEVINPNLMTNFYYDDIYFSVYHGKHRQASTVFPSFNQTARDTKPINVTVYLSLVTTARETGNHLPTYSFEEFDVKLITFIKWRFWSSKSKSVRVYVSCDDVGVSLLLATGGHGKMIGPAKICRVS